MKVVLVLSGGLDSVVLLHQLCMSGSEVHALGFNYGQRHAAKELAFAQQHCAALGVPWRLVDLCSLQALFGANALTDAAVAVPEGGIADPAMAATVVPNRNMVFLAIAAGWALALGAETVAYAAHGGSDIYPDCSPAFVAALDAALFQADHHRVQLVAPYVNHGKDYIVNMGHTLGVPMAETWSCYNAGALHCGRCGTCNERRGAFKLAKVPDPTEYEATEPLPD